MKTLHWRLENETEGEPFMRTLAYSENLEKLGIVKTPYSVTSINIYSCPGMLRDIKHIEAY